MPALNDKELLAWVRHVSRHATWMASVCTGAGVSAGIGMALALTGRVHGPATAEALQLVIEYDPQPPYDADAPHKASDRVKQAAGKILAAAAI